MADVPPQRQRRGSIDRCCFLLTPLLFAMATACGNEPAGRFAQETPPAPVADDDSALRFGPTLASARRPDETVAGLVEVDQPDHGRLDMLVAVMRASADPVVEMWRFRQATPADPLKRDGEPVVMLRSRRNAVGSPELADFRVRMAAPNSKARRMGGIVADSASAALEQLTAAARTVGDASGAAQARVDALATVVRGLDDGMLLERDELGLTLDELAHEHWLAREVTSASDRRATAITRSGATLELLRKGDGWVIASHRAP